MPPKVSDELRYTKEHEWARREGVRLRVGITDHAQSRLGDVVFVELPEVGRSVEAGKPVAVVESVKAASDIYAPVAGVVVEVNASLGEHPERVNADPHGEGWFFVLEVSGDPEVAWRGLLDAAAYRAHVAA